MRFHILGLPHTVSSKDYVACAYTQKAVKFGKMMTARGHEVIHYGHEDSDLICTENVGVTTNKDLEKAYGSYDWKNNFFKFDVNDHAYQTFYKNAVIEIQKRKRKNDFILPFWGAGVRPVCDAHPDLITVEPGIGYAGGHWARWKVFESYAIMHAFYGLDAVGTCKQDWYNVVIPNYFDLDEFEYAPEKKEDYFLFLGRVYSGKGIDIAMQVTEKIGAKLKIAGQNPENREFPDHVEFIGYADIPTRKKLMSRAKGSFVASMYVEPFGGVQVENLISGTPTITTDWGAFTENNIHGVTGFRCNTFQDFVDAANNIGDIDPADCRAHGEKFSLENIAPKYEKFFQDVLNVYEGDGWYHIDNKRVKTLNSLENTTQNVMVIGACDGVSHDHLHQYIIKNEKWKTVFVEPVKEYFKQLKENYKKYPGDHTFINAAITEESGNKDIYRVKHEDFEQGKTPVWANGVSTFYPDKNALSKLDNEIVKENVTCITVEELMKKAKMDKIDILQIDAEGYDKIIFDQIWELNYRPKIINIEVVTLSNSDIEELTKTLRSGGYHTQRDVVNNDDLVAIDTSYL